MKKKTGKAVQPQAQSFVLELHPAMKWALLLAPALVLAVFTFHDWWGPDFWYHLFLGRATIQQRTFSPTDNLILQQPSYVNQYWFFQGVIFQAYRWLGYWGVRAVFVVLWLFILKFSSHFFRTRLSPIPASLLMILAAIFFQHRMEFRPEVCSYFFAALCLQLLYGQIAEGEFVDKIRLRPVALWAVLQWEWSQCHGYFFVGTAFAGLAAMGEFLEGRKKSAVGFLVLALTGAAAICLPPLGWKSWWDFWHLFQFLQTMSSGIEEFLPSYMPIYLRSWTTCLFWAAWLVTLVLLPLSPKSRGNTFRIGLAAMALYLSARHYRNIPLLPLFCAPLWAEIAKEQLPRLRLPAGWDTRWNPTLAAVPLVLCATILWSTVTGKYHWSRYSEARTSFGPSEIAFPVKFSAYLAKQPFDGKIFNEPSDGGFLEFHHPNVHFYGDSRFVDAANVTEYFRAASNPLDFDALHKRHQFDGVVLWILRQQEVILHLMKNPDWRIAYMDLDRVFFVHRSSEKGKGLPSWPADWSAVADWSHGDNPARIKQWLLFFSHLRRHDDFKGLFSQIEAFHANVKDFGEIAIRTGIEQQNGELAARGDAFLRNLPH